MATNQRSSIRSSQLVQDLVNAKRQLFLEAEEQVRQLNIRVTRISSAFEREVDRIRNQRGVVETINSADGHQVTASMRTVRPV